jgi:hypothetical protein
MTRNGRNARPAIAVLNVLFGGLGIWGGGQVLVFFREASAVGIAIGAAGLMAGISFALAGLAIGRGWRGARAWGFSASATTIIVYVAGIGLGIIGLSGALFGIVYPALVMAWLAGRGSGLGHAAGSETPAPDHGRNDRTLPRVRAATA